MQNGDNPSTDFYLRPRLAATGLTAQVLNLSSDPKALTAELSAGSAWVIICRYINPAWLAALERAQGLARISLFMDDDIQALFGDPGVPWLYKAHIHKLHARFAHRLHRLVDDVMVSTPALCARYPGATIISPMPEANYAAKAASSRTIACHLGAPHRPERRFALAVCRRLLQLDSSLNVEITVNGADAGLRRLPPNITPTPELGWPDYRRRAEGCAFGLFMAPLFPSPSNSARAPVKFFDATRLGAVGVYADAPPFQDFVENDVDGVLLPMSVEIWAKTLVRLAAEPDRVARIAAAALLRTRSYRPEGLPSLPSP